MNGYGEPCPDATWLADAVGGELQALATRVDQLEAAIGHWIDTAGLGPEAIQELQASDLIGQTLRELAGMLDRYREAADVGLCNAVDDSLQPIRLGALRERLLAHRAGLDAPAETVDALELF